MENKFEKIIMGVLVVFVLIVGSMFFFQKKEINQIKAQISRKDVGLAVNNASSAPNEVADIEAQKNLAGEIKAVAVDSLAVEAKLQKLKNPDKFKTDKPINMGPDDFETITKPVKVLLNDKTRFINLKKEDLKVGDKILVTADNSPFKAETLTALTIAYPARDGFPGNIPYLEPR